MERKGVVTLTAELPTFTLEGVADRTLAPGVQITLLPESEELEGGRIRKIRFGSELFWVTAEDLEAALGTAVPAHC